MSSFERTFESELQRTKEDAARNQAAAKDKQNRVTAYETASKRRDGNDLIELFGQHQGQLVLDFLALMKSHRLPGAIDVKEPTLGYQAAPSFLARLVGMRPEVPIKGYQIGRASTSNPLIDMPDFINRGVLPEDFKFKIKPGYGPCKVIGGDRFAEKFVGGNLPNSTLSQVEISRSTRIMICEDGRVRTEEGFNMPPNDSFKIGHDIVTRQIMLDDYDTTAYYFCSMPLETVLSVTAADLLKDRI